MTKDEDDGKPPGERSLYDSGAGVSRELDIDDTSAIFLLDGILTHLRGICATGESLTVNFANLSEGGQRRVLARAADLFREAADTLHDAGRLASTMIRQKELKYRKPTT